MRSKKQGFSAGSLLTHLEGMPIVAMGYVQNIERQESDAYKIFWKTAKGESHDEDK